MRKCKKCGEAVGMEDLYCIHCGALLEKEPAQETKKPTEKELAPPLQMGDYLLIFILLAIPIVNIVVPLLWIFGKNENRNRQNLAKAWLILMAVGVALSVIFSIGLFRSMEIDRVQREYRNYMEYPDGKEKHWEDILTEWDEV